MVTLINGGVRSSFVRHSVGHMSITPTVLRLTAMFSIPDSCYERDQVAGILLHRWLIWTTVRIQLASGERPKSRFYTDDGLGLRRALSENSWPWTEK